MTSSEADDPYVYPGTQTLRNTFGILDPDQLRETEFEYTQQRLAEPLPRIKLAPRGYRALHRHIFQDVYPWAGEIRGIPLAKGDNLFALPAFLASNLDGCFESIRRDDRLLGNGPECFLEASAEHANELNALHPFRDGNGRTQRLLLEILAERAGYHLAVDRIGPQQWTEASIIGFHKADDAPMRDVLRAALVVPTR